MKFDHVALQSKSISESVEWYLERFGGEVVYQDDTWAEVKVCGLNLAFVTPGQHPSHVAFSLTEEEAEKFPDKSFKLHRDGTRSFYEKDNQGNILEFIVRPNAEES